jgi:hypothetical protein
MHLTHEWWPFFNRSKANDRFHFDYSCLLSFTLQYRHPGVSRQYNPVAPALFHTSFTSSLYHHSENIPITANTITMATMNIERKVDQARDVAQGASQIVTNKAQSALESVKQMSIVQRDVFPHTRYLKNRYVQALTSVKIGVIGFGAMSAIPLGCFMGFMGLVTLVCMIVGGIGFTVVEVRYVSLVQLRRRYTLEGQNLIGETDPKTPYPNPSSSTCVNHHRISPRADSQYSVQFSYSQPWESRCWLPVVSSWSAWSSISGTSWPVPSWT